MIDGDLSNDVILENQTLYSTEYDSHYYAALTIFGVFGIISITLFIFSVKDGWQVLMKNQPRNQLMSYIRFCFLYGTHCAPIFSRFFRASLDFKVDGLRR